ncbi:hypothetical protein [Alkalibacillus haloalkaliphilus]|nr:hypothetical protein [Alkalibacillus haloalkaliphilus]MDV2582446.1 hypothetical protein [Alkalibacillus haloalkaliphilus]
MRLPSLKTNVEPTQSVVVTKQKLTQKSFVTNLGDYLMEKLFLLLGTYF